MMPKKKKLKAELNEQPEETLEDLPFAPPEIRELAERYTVTIPVSDQRIGNRWELRLYAEKQLESRLGDTVQLTSMRVHPPHLVAKTKARILKREPQARLVVTIEF